MSVATLANRFVSVYRATDTQDAWGGVTKTWAVNTRTKVRCQPLTGGRRLDHLRSESRVSHMAYFAGTPDVVEGDRFKSPVKAEKWLYVLYVANVDLADRFLTCECEERDD